LAMGSGRKYLNCRQYNSGKEGDPNQTFRAAPVSRVRDTE
jgi:hypothetical protein